MRDTFYLVATFSRIEQNNVGSLNNEFIIHISRMKKIENRNAEIILRNFVFTNRLML